MVLSFLGCFYHLCFVIILLYWREKIKKCPCILCTHSSKGVVDEDSLLDFKERVKKIPMAHNPGLKERKYMKCKDNEDD